MERAAAPLKVIPVQAAIGMVLGHDLTRIVPGEFKGPAFRRGHVVRAEDVPDLLLMGKERLYVYDPAAGLVHEDDAARRMARALAGDGVRFSEPGEGRVNLIAERPGLLKIDRAGLSAVNAIPEIVVASLHGDRVVEAGRAVAGTRVIPLVVAEDKLSRVENLCREFKPVVEVKPFLELPVGVVTTGSEVYHGRIKDTFGPVVRRKFGALGCPDMGQTFVPDDVDMTVAAIRGFLERGAGLVAVTGGMSVDPDDRTPASIRALGGEVVTYGAPAFPGAMFMLAYVNGTPVVGLPGCVMYARASVFDLIVPRIVAGERPTREEIVALGHGGYCADCAECRFPDCAFGKGF